MSITVAVVAMGEMGAGVAAQLVRSGARVRTSLQGRSPASAERARAAGVEAVATDRELVEGADLFLSIVPPARARSMAERVLPELRRAARPPVFVDCNAIAPQTLGEIAAPFQDGGLPIVDAGIIGFAPRPDGYNPRIYVSGPDVEPALRLSDFGLDVRPVGEALGDASALKMAYAGYTKGTQAVFLSVLMGAARSGVARPLIEEMGISQEGKLEAQMRNLPMVLRKAYRWDGEMEEIARWLLPETGASQIFQGAADIYRHLARDFADGPDAERMALLAAFQEP